MSTLEKVPFATFTPYRSICGTQVFFQKRLFQVDSNIGDYIRVDHNLCHKPLNSHIYVMLWLRSHHWKEVASLPDVKIGAHLEIHSADKHRFAILSVKVLAHPGAVTTTAGRSVGTASLPDVKIGAHLEIHSADKHRFAILSVKVLAHPGAGTTTAGRSIWPTWQPLLSCLI